MPVAVPTTQESPNAPLRVAVAIVIAMTVITLALVGAAVVTKDCTTWITVGAIWGSLATALNAAVGIKNALRAAIAAKDGQA